jgi:hypothetical protein
LPADRTLHGFGDFILKVCPLFLAVLTIALFPRGAWSLGLILLGFVFYLGYVDSAFVIQVSHLLDAAVAGEAKEQFNAFYRFAIFVNAYTVLSAVFAYRLGGASAARVMKLGGAGILLLISGLNDLTMWAMYPWPDGQRPTEFSWASHVSIFLGHPPTLPEMLAFLAVHLFFAAVLLALPLERWRDRLAARAGSYPVSPQHAPTDEPSTTTLSRMALYPLSASERGGAKRRGEVGPENAQPGRLPLAAESLVTTAPTAR